MKEGSYHGYATTDYYTVDPRFGTMDDYLNLSTIAEKNNIKLIKDIIVNHCGLYHWWMEDLPFDDWLNFQEIYLNSTDDTIEQNTVYSNHTRYTHNIHCSQHIQIFDFAAHDLYLIILAVQHKLNIRWPRQEKQIIYAVLKQIQVKYSLASASNTNHK